MSDKEYPYDKETQEWMNGSVGAYQCSNCGGVLILEPKGELCDKCEFLESRR